MPPFAASQYPKPSTLVAIIQVTGGRNGYGAKLANIFSKEFIVETCDGARKRRYKQVCSITGKVGM